jgi:hypothetical protein
MGKLRKVELTDQFLSLNSVIKRSNRKARVKGRDEILSLRSPDHNHADLMVRPVNNFLKDLDQIELEFRREGDSDPLHFKHRAIRGNIIPIDEALNGCMEENY